MTTISKDTFIIILGMTENTKTQNKNVKVIQNTVIYKD